MAVLKQIFVTLAVVLVGAGLWVSFDPKAGDLVLNSGLPLPAPVVDLVEALAPESGTDTAKIGATPAPGGRGAPRATTVTAGTVETSLTRSRMRAIGTGEAERSVAVYPDVTGIVRTVSFKSGDDVAVGDVLVDLESDTEALAVDRARIALASAGDKVGRVARLEASRAVSAVDVTDAGRLLESARLDLRGAEIALEKRRIVAPIAGRVGIVSVDTGDLVTGQTLITTIDDRSRIKVIFYTPESFVQELGIGEPIEAVSTARPEKTYSGTISAIDSRLDEASRTLRTEAIVDNEGDELRPGMSFSIALALPGETLLSVDPLAVQWERSGPIVWKIDGADVAKTPIRIVERNIDRVLVTSDVLKKDDLVVVEGLQSIREGGKVSVQNAPSPAKRALSAKDAPPAEAGPSSPSADGTAAPSQGPPARTGEVDGAAGHASVAETTRAAAPKTVAQ